MSDQNRGERLTRVSGSFEPTPQRAATAAMSLQVGRAANAVNDGDSSVTDHSVRSISAATASTMEHSFTINENHRMRDELKNIARCSRRQRAKGEHVRRRHNKMSADDLNNVHAIREFV